MTLKISPITTGEHVAYATAHDASFLQLPSWGRVKTGWHAESIGWFDKSEIVGTGLLLRRPVPVLRRYLAYLPEGPTLDWPSRSAEEWLSPLADYASQRRAFSLKIGPQIPLRRWHADTIKAAVTNADVSRLGEVAPDWHDEAAAGFVDELRALGWIQEANSGVGFGDVQPRYVFQLQLAGRSLDDVFAGFNQQWRRNVRKAEKVGVTVDLGGVEDLEQFHRIYVETAARDRFTPRGLVYFQRMFTQLQAEDPARATLFIARHEGIVHAATIMIRVGGHAWYSYGASTTAGRDLRPSNAIQWAMISAAHSAGSEVYDLRGITDSVDPAHPLYGLIGFKLGTGGYAQEYVGEWDLVLRPILARAVGSYLKRRQ